MNNWIREHKWLTTIGAVAIVGIIASAASGPATVDKTTPNATYQPSETSAALQNTASPAPNLSNDNTYVNSSGNTIHSPANTLDNTVPADASARCRDGTYSFSQHRSGTCSHHGGVASWL